MLSVISNTISSCLPWCLTCMSGNDWCDPSERECNLKEAKLRKLAKQKTEDAQMANHCINR